MRARALGEPVLELVDASRRDVLGSERVPDIIFGDNSVSSEVGTHGLQTQYGSRRVLRLCLQLRVLDDDLLAEATTVGEGHGKLSAEADDLGAKGQCLGLDLDNLLALLAELLLSLIGTTGCIPEHLAKRGDLVLQRIDLLRISAGQTILVALQLVVRVEQLAETACGGCTERVCLLARLGPEVLNVSNPGASGLYLAVALLQFTPQFTDVGLELRDLFASASILCVDFLRARSCGLERGTGLLQSANVLVL
ncbi:hypothetical protein C8Q74DRAFT_462421 [Fomes fomentarius]|nr:hypothetical protein C8Q74DRAFT_462421 [Fomes fomentarius]